MIHSHSDLFDLLLIGGVVGLSIWVLFFFTLLRQTQQSPSRKSEFTFVTAIFFVAFSYSLFTSAFYGPNVMGVIILSIVAISNMNTKSPPEARGDFKAPF